MRMRGQVAAFGEPALQFPMPGRGVVQHLRLRLAIANSHQIDRFLCYINAYNHIG